MPNDDDMEKLDMESEPGKKEDVKDIKTSISIPTSVRDKIYYNKGAAHSYGDFINECIDAWLKTNNKEDVTPKSKRRG